ncbi:MAG TPA: AAA family ATPase [Candidatus Cloacimonas acidaminovorans]|jgi:wobble nucleotide-excising tRNase|nr:AAA family ATPase [Candidatus Cloacimonas acidaminovorans]
MLEKVISLKNIGRFLNYSASGDVAFCKLTLIYAENGRGKTTFCSILRSLQSGQPEFIMERKTLGTTDLPYVHMRLNNEDKKFTQGNWSSVHQNILIFDSVFVNENVYSGDYVEHDQKKNLYRIIVGSDGVKLAREIEDLDSKIRDVNNNLRTNKDSLARYIPEEITFEEFLEWQPVPDIEEQIKKKNKELEKMTLAASKATEIKTKSMLMKVHLPSLPSDFINILSKELNNIIADAETKVRGQINKHKMGSYGETWLSQGLTFINDNHCPFCEQELEASELIKAYSSYFSEAYENIKQEISQLTQMINNSIGETSLSSVQQTIADNKTLLEFWKQFTDIILPDISFNDVQQKYMILRNKCFSLAQKKQDCPTEAITIDSEFSAAIKELEDLQTVVESYNASINNSNELIKKQKEISNSSNDIGKLKNELNQLEAHKKRFEPDISNLCQKYQDNAKSKKEIEDTKESKRKELDNYCTDILQKYEQTINKYLDQFNTGFRITNTRHLYTGGTPSSQYQIFINNTQLQLGDSRTPAGTPCFKTTLSSGDRNALALAFFLAMIEQDNDIVKKIIVFDDPFISLDRFRRTCTAQIIIQLLSKAQQVIVLSHDPFFLKLLHDECPDKSTLLKTLQMNKSACSTIITEWDAQAETQSPYLRDYNTLLGFYRERKGDLYDVARTIRPFLEGMLRHHFPGHFTDKEWLGDMIEKIRNANEQNGLGHAKADLNEIEAINAYSKKFHHNQNTNADNEPINDDELHGYVRRTLQLVGGE